MALKYADRVKETTTVTGTGAATLLGAVSTLYASMNTAVGNGNKTCYCIADSSAWEIGLGTYTHSGTSLSRDLVIASSNAGALVSFAAGTKDVFTTAPGAMLGSNPGPTPPSPAIPGMFWVNTNDGTLNTYYDDGDSLQWIQLTSSVTYSQRPYVGALADMSVALVGHYVASGNYTLGNKYFCGAPCTLTGVRTRWEHATPRNLKASVYVNGGATPVCSAVGGLAAGVSEVQFSTPLAIAPGSTIIIAVYETTGTSHCWTPTFSALPSNTLTSGHLIVVGGFYSAGDALPTTSSGYPGSGGLSACHPILG